jgi:hypothetical protein
VTGTGAFPGLGYCYSLVFGSDPPTGTGEAAYAFSRTRAVMGASGSASDLHPLRKSG